MPSLRIVQMHGAGQARVKGVDGAQNLDGLVDPGHRRTDQSLLKGGALALGVARGTVPGGRNYQLIVGDCAVMDLDPVGQSAARRFHQAHAPASLGQLFGSQCSPLKVDVSRIFTRSINSP